MQGAPTVHSSAIFRQSNEFFYLTGVGVPQAMLLIDGATRDHFYLPKQDARAPRRRRHAVVGRSGGGRGITGVDEVKAPDQLEADLAARSKEPA